MTYLPLILSGVLSLGALCSFSQKPMKIDLHDAMQRNRIQVYNRDLTLIDEESYKGIRLSKAFGEGIAWLKGVELSNGTIEFDVRGEDVKQHSFVGIAFHGQNDSIFDAVYLRPFHFKAQDTILRKRAIQYISLPTYTWRKLREQSPGKYENSIHPAPDPDGWVHMRLVIKDSVITVYINGNQEPSLVAEKVTPVHTGSVGFYVADTSGGDFANIVVIRD
jgi:hypothetical protein